MAGPCLWEYCHHSVVWGGETATGRPPGHLSRAVLPLNGHLGEACEATLPGVVRVYQLSPSIHGLPAQDYISQPPLQPV